MTVERDRHGRWIVLHGGFSRSTQHSLMQALAEATGEHHGTRWLTTLARQIEAAG